MKRLSTEIITTAASFLIALAGWSYLAIAIGERLVAPAVI